MRETPFMRALLRALEVQPWCVVWRQNVGAIVVRDERGRAKRRFQAGAPAGAADISGFVRPEGWRLEIETKAADGRIRATQLTFGRVLVTGGGVYVVVKYEPRLSPSQNVQRGVELVVRAIRQRRAAT